MPVAGDSGSRAWPHSARRLVGAAALVMVLAAFSAWRLSFYRTQADEVRDQLLRGAQTIQDLRDVASTVRLTEAAGVIGQPAKGAPDGDQALGRLDNRVTLLEHGFEHLRHTASVMQAYVDFKVRWSIYRADAARAVALAREGRRQDTARLYEGESSTAYAAAADALHRLAERNQEAVAAVAARADAGYRDARFTTLMAFGLAGLLLIGGLIEYLRRRLAREAR